MNITLYPSTDHDRVDALILYLLKQLTPGREVTLTTVAIGDSMTMRVSQVFAALPSCGLPVITEKFLPTLGGLRKWA